MRRALGVVLQHAVHGGPAAQALRFGPAAPVTGKPVVAAIQQPDNRWARACMGCHGRKPLLEHSLRSCSNVEISEGIVLRLSTISRHQKSAERAARLPSNEGLRASKTARHAPPAASYWPARRRHGPKSRPVTAGMRAFPSSLLGRVFVVE